MFIRLQFAAENDNNDAGYTADVMTVLPDTVKAGVVIQNSDDAGYSYYIDCGKASQEAVAKVLAEFKKQYQHNVALPVDPENLPAVILLNRLLSPKADKSYLQSAQDAWHNLNLRQYATSRNLLFAGGISAAALVIAVGANAIYKNTRGSSSE